MCNQNFSLLLEKKIIFENIDLLDLFGEKEIRLKVIKSYYPKLKIILRGECMLIFGEENLVKSFELKLNNMIQRYKLNNNLLENDIHYIFSDLDNEFFSQDVILHSYSGLVVKARTKNQKKIIKSQGENCII